MAGLKKPAEKLHYLSGLSLFKGISKKHLNQIAGKMELLHAKRDQVIFADKDKDVGLLFLLSGSIQVELGTEPSILYKKGEMIGMTAFFLGEAAKGKAVSLTESKLLNLKTQNFLWIASHFPKLQFPLYRIFAKALRNELTGVQQMVRNSLVCLVHLSPNPNTSLSEELATNIETESGKKAIVFRFQQKRTKGAHIKNYKYNDSLRILETFGRHYSSHSILITELFPEDDSTLAKLLLDEADSIEIIKSRHEVETRWSKLYLEEVKESKSQIKESILKDNNYPIRRRSREIAGVQVGVALGGGAALGLSQVGIMKVMEEEGLSVDIICGTSIGAVIGAFWASGLGFKGIQPLLEEVDSIFKMIKLMDVTFPGQGLLHGKSIKSLLEKFLGDLYFEELPIKLKLVACEIATRKEVILDKGRVLDAIMASISIPGVFIPQPQEDGRVFVDGGIVNPLPVSPLLVEGVKKIITINSMPSSNDSMKSNKFLNLEVLDIVVNSLYSLQYKIGANSTRDVSLYLNPILPNSNWLEFWRSSEFIALGESYALAHLNNIRRLFKKG